MQNRDQRVSGLDLHALFAERVDRAAAVERSVPGAEAGYRKLIGGCHDAAALLGLDQLARCSLELLAGNGVGLQALREALPAPEFVETRLAELATANDSSHGAGDAEWTLIVLSAASDPHSTLRELAAIVGDRSTIVGTLVAAVTEVKARPYARIVLAVDAVTLPEHVVSSLGRELEAELRSGRLGMLLVSESAEFAELRRAWDEGFVAVEHCGQSISVLERRLESVAARCCVDSSGLRALLVDSDPLTIAACTALFAAADIESTPLQSIDELPRVVAECNPDLAVISGELSGVPGEQIAELLEMCGLDKEPSTVFLGRTADLPDCGRAVHPSGFESLLPQNGPTAFLQRILRRGAAARAHANERRGTSRHVRRLEQVIDALNQHALVSETDASGVIVHVNKKFCEVSGFSRQELVGHNHRVLNSGVTQGKLEDMWETISSGNVWQGSICNRRKDGSMFWVQTTIVPFSDEYGRRYRYYSVRTDVTELKELEQQLSLRAKAIEASSDGILLADASHPDMPLVEVNAAFENTSGYKRAEVIGRNCRFLQGSDTDPGQVAEIREALVEKRGIEVTLLNYRKDGSSFWNALRLSPIFSDTGELTHYLGVQHDVTRFVAAEQDARRARHRQELAQQHAAIASWEADAQTGEIFWTDNMSELFGYEPGELVPCYRNFVGALHRDDRNEVLRALRSAWRNDLPYESEHRVVWPDGTVRWLSAKGAVERAESGEPLRMIGVVQDIDERKRALMELVAAREQADRANQAKSEFLSRMSHELRTPMNAVLGFAQLIQADPGMPEEHRDNSGEIIKAGHHLLELIDEVLDLSKIESGRIQVSIEPISVAPLVDECTSLLEDMAHRHSISINREVEDVLVVRADRTRLKQTLLNLLSNAIKYNRPGGQVWLRAAPGEIDDGATISVADTGTGIAADKLARLYEPFDRLDAETTEVAGTGIGLTITRRLVELMGGTIRVQSEPGQGSTFMIDLALADEVPETGPDEASDETAESAALPDSALVLYIEDNPSNIRLMARALAGQRHINLVTAHSAELGIELAVSRRPDLIMVDINLPGMDGYEVLGVLRAESSLAQVPVLAISANAMPHDIDRGYKAGFADYLTKPLDIDKLLDTISGFIAAGRAG